MPQKVTRVSRKSRRSRKPTRRRPSRALSILQNNFKRARKRNKKRVSPSGGHRKYRSTSFLNAVNKRSKDVSFKLQPNKASIVDPMIEYLVNNNEEYEYVCRILKTVGADDRDFEHLGNLMPPEDRLGCGGTLSEFYTVLNRQQKPSYLSPKEFYKRTCNIIGYMRAVSLKAQRLEQRIQESLNKPESDTLWKLVHDLYTCAYHIGNEESFETRIPFKCSIKQDNQEIATVELQTLTESRDASHPSLNLRITGPIVLNEQSSYDTTKVTTFDITVLDLSIHSDDAQVH